MTIAFGILAALLAVYAAYLRRQRNGWRNNATRTHDINRQLRASSTCTPPGSPPPSNSPCISTGQAAMTTDRRAVTPLERLSGHTVLIGRACGVQFGDGRHLVLRVIDAEPSKYWDGMAWISGYVLDTGGKAVDKREVYVIVDGLRVAEPSCTCPPITSRFPHNVTCRRAHLGHDRWESIEDRAKQGVRNTGPVIPRPRTSTETTTGSTR